MDDMEKMMQQIMEMLVEMKASGDAYQEKMATDRKADQEKMAADKEDLLARMEAKIDANRKKAEADKEEMLARIKEEDRQANKELLARMDAMFETYKKTMMATEKIEQNLEMMQSAEEHQDVPTEAVVVRAVKGLKKRHRGRKSTAERHGKPKKGT
jgi:hypothetical protein